MAIAETVGERVKLALANRGLTVTAAAATLGLSRPTLSVKISQDDFRESEIEALAELTGTTPAYLRYGISGDFEDGAREATAWMRRALDRFERLLGAGGRPVGGTLHDDEPDLRDKSAARSKRRGA